MNCKICNSEATKIFTSDILNKYKDIKYFHCEHCGFLFTQEPFWLDQAYSAAISSLDTGAITRNISLHKIVSVLIYFLFNKSGKFLDFAGGHGVFTRLLRDIGFDFYWNDLYAKNLFAVNFEYDHKIKNIELITAIECFEHFVDPAKEIDNLIKISPNIFFTTNLLPDPIPQPKEWWYYALESGQHISFYSKKTLDFIANKYGLNFYSYGGIHLFTKKKINYRLLNFLINKTNKFLFNFVRKRLKGKAVDDMNYIKREIFNRKNLDENLI